MEGWWDCQSLDEAVNRFLSRRLLRRLPLGPARFLGALSARLFNLQSWSRSKTVARVHYDLGNDFYRDMLDGRMQYTCAYWKDARNLDEAQEHKLDLICRKLHLRPGMSILELGCGWGGFARFAAERYGCRVKAYNISERQVEYAREQARGLPVEILLQDYREARGRFDRVVSIGLCEHVGYKNYRNFFQIIHRCLKDDGLALVHTIGGNRSVTTTDPWLDKYIFPHSVLPSARQLAEGVERLFVLEDWHNFGPDYDRTLMAWQANFSRNWSRHEAKFGDGFRRMWEYYLLSCAGTFRARMNQLWQIVLSKHGVPGGYAPVR
jgi:cyclopropane-fatty-acyl-phospholipid synthase